MELLSVISTATTTKTSCFFLSICIGLLSFAGRSTVPAGWSSFVPLLLCAFVIAGLFVVAVRTTIVTWISVLVILAFAGKRRRVLAVEGRKITEDVALYLFQDLVKDRYLVAVACATLLSSMALACLN